MARSLIWLSVAVTSPLGPPQAARADPLDVRPTDLTVAEFRQLPPDERALFLDGFALAGTATGDGDDGVAGAPPDSRIAAVLAEQPPRGSGPVDGARWVALEPRQRLALLAGYNAGAWVAALCAQTGQADNATLAAARRLLQPAPVPAPSLLAARLADWLFYTDRRAAPLQASIATITRQIAEGGS
jgi:hypothetical protein